MSELKKPKIASEAEVMAELGNVQMSSEALSKMSLNPYDQLFICRLMNMRDDAAKDEMYDAVAEVVGDQNRRMFTILDEQTLLMKAMAIDIVDIKLRLAVDENTLKLLEARFTADRVKLEIVENDVKVIKRDVTILKKKVGTVETKVKILVPDKKKKIMLRKPPKKLTK